MVEKITSLLAFVLVLLTGMVQAQDDLFSELDEVQTEDVKYETAFFKQTRVVNSPSIEMTAPGVMNFMIQHRFGTINNGFYDLFGIDNSQVRLSFDFGLTPYLMVGIGRSGLEKTFDLNTKLRILRQQKGTRNIPVSVSFYGATFYKTLKSINELTTANRLSYLGQVIIARKFSPNFSLQVSPTIVHENLTELRSVDNDIFAIGVGARQKVSKRVAINFDYVYRLPGNYLTNTYNSLALGVDIETGGHVFSLHLTNSRGMFDKAYVTETYGDLGNGDLYFGFNINRVFTVAKSREKKELGL
ncbi:DUF5777 family beta-barrel protein [Luteibaculum oceani]|uniref:DUF5777 domain-containing protein n=1 Tax=Luteibaculum oceani TaxID=1294296 RepID=A0A5C6VAE0_9FLAO|nr:DUF5777 family beta-barrel protein [Luteibaculum oceani]TXC81471.1 hypothetical protein FRX97_05555 [Luteibaculum oceani]